MKGIALALLEFKRNLKERFFNYKRETIKFAYPYLIKNENASRREIKKGRSSCALAQGNWDLLASQELKSLYYASRRD